MNTPLLKVDTRWINHKLIPDDLYDFDNYVDLTDENEIKEGMFDQFSWFYKGIINIGNVVRDKNKMESWNLNKLFYKEHLYGNSSYKTK